MTQAHFASEQLYCGEFKSLESYLCTIDKPQLQWSLQKKPYRQVHSARTIANRRQHIVWNSRYGQKFINSYRKRCKTAINEIIFKRRLDTKSK